MPEAITPQATPTGAAHAPDSLEAAVEAFRKLPSRLGTQEPREVKPPTDVVEEPEEGTETPEVTPETEEPETPETPEVDPDAEETETPESPEEGTEETEDEVPPETPRSRKIKLPDGTEEEVTEDEAYKGYLRTADYTRKTQIAAAEKKEAEAEKVKAREDRALYAAQLEQVKKAMDTIVPKEPDWNQLRATVTPEEFAATWADWQAFSQKRNAVIAEQNRVAGETKKDFEARLGQYVVQESQRLIEVIPDWADESKAKTELGTIKAYAMAQGWTEEEVDSIVDSRQVLAWRKAMLWDKLQTGKPVLQGKVKPKSKLKPATPGSPASRTKPAPVSDEARDKAALAKSGDLRSAASVFSHVLKRGSSTGR